MLPGYSAYRPALNFVRFTHSLIHTTHPPSPPHTHPYTPSTHTNTSPPQRRNTHTCLYTPIHTHKFYLAACRVSGPFWDCDF